MQREKDMNIVDRWCWCKDGRGMGSGRGGIAERAKDRVQVLLPINGER